VLAETLNGYAPDGYDDGGHDLSIPPPRQEAAPAKPARRRKGAKR
jgi:hypothetical protein